jgi:hypothetical protein
MHLFGHTFDHDFFDTIWVRRECLKYRIQFAIKGIESKLNHAPSRVGADIYIRSMTFSGRLPTRGATKTGPSIFCTVSLARPRCLFIHIVIKLALPPLVTMFAGVVHCLITLGFDDTAEVNS